ncbi:MAG: hypothetical protein AB7O45_11800 [Alphaproteobacteria bacterium]
MFTNVAERSVRRPTGPQVRPALTPGQSRVRARAAAIAIAAAATILLSLVYSASSPAGAANFEYGPEIEQRFMDTCMRTNARPACQCRMETMQRQIGMAAFLTAVEQGSEQALFGMAVGASFAPSRRCAALVDVEASGEAVAGEVQVQ